MKQIIQKTKLTLRILTGLTSAKFTSTLKRVTILLNKKKCIKESLKLKRERKSEQESHDGPCLGLPALCQCSHSHQIYHRG